MFKITVKYGIDQHVLESLTQPTIRDLRENQTLRAILGYGDNVRAMIEGVEQPNALLVPNGAVVMMETACNTKAY